MCTLHSHTHHHHHQHPVDLRLVYAISYAKMMNCDSNGKKVKNWSCNEHGWMDFDEHLIFLVHLVWAPATRCSGLLCNLLKTTDSDYVIRDNEQHFVQKSRNVRQKKKYKICLFLRSVGNLKSICGENDWFWETFQITLGVKMLPTSTFVLYAIHMKYWIFFPSRKMHSKHLLLAGIALSKTVNT